MQTEMLIGGAFTAGENSCEAILNPRTGATIAEVPEASDDQVEAAVAAGAGAFEAWSRTAASERSARSCASPTGLRPTPTASRRSRR